MKSRVTPPPLQNSHYFIRQSECLTDWLTAASLFTLPSLSTIVFTLLVASQLSRIRSTQRSHWPAEHSAGVHQPGGQDLINSHLEECEDLLNHFSFNLDIEDFNEDSTWDTPVSQPVSQCVSEPVGKSVSLAEFHLLSSSSCLVLSFLQLSSAISSGWTPPPHTQWPMPLPFSQAEHGSDSGR